MRVDWKQRYYELIRRVKLADKHFQTEEGKYYRFVWADDFPEFFNDSEVLRSKQ